MNTNNLESLNKNLRIHADKVKAQTLKNLAEGRKNRFLFETDYLYLDGARNFLSDESFALISSLLENSDFKEKRKLLYGGGILNKTENRSCDHIALRDVHGLYNGPEKLKQEISETMQKMEGLVRTIHSGKATPTLAGNIRYVVNIGIGGSDLGPRMVVDALGEFESKLAQEIFFIATVDEYELQRVLDNIYLPETVFISVSKSLSTPETLKITSYFMDELSKQGLDYRQHLILATANRKAAETMKVHPENCLYFPESIGGRFSLWSSTGFVIAVYLGFEGFCELLRGASDMDRHFLEAPVENNLPVFLAFLEFWYTNFFDSSFLTVNAYTERLRYFPMYLQQLQMESNGKSVDNGNNPVAYKTAEAVFGVTGTPAQHSYFQALHQGTHFFHADFIGLCESAPGKGDDASKARELNRFLFSNMLAQAHTLADGLQAGPEIPAYKEIAGNKPCNIFLLKEWNPATLGYLISLYEHKTFVLGTILGINSFDQWGVERGKKISTMILDFMDNPDRAQSPDPVTLGTLNLFRKNS